MLRNPIIALILLLGPATASADTLTVSYIERKPFYFTENGQASGTLLDKVRSALGEAKVPHQFVPMAIPRIMAELKSKKPHCSIGWYKTPEREAFAEFSAPFARDEPFEVMTRKDLGPKLAAYQTLASLFSNKDLTLGVASGFSYGEALDQMIKAQKPKLIDTEPEHGSLVSMLAKGRFSYMFVNPAELDTMLAGSGLKAEDFQRRTMGDMPPGASRHLMCSRGTAKADLTKLNDAIRKLFPEI